MGKRKREHREAVAAGNEKPFRAGTEKVQMGGKPRWRWRIPWRPQITHLDIKRNEDTH